MNYLFFDIECANRDETGRNQIYSFGYLVVDENMQVVEKEKDIAFFLENGRNGSNTR